MPIVAMNRLIGAWLTSGPQHDPLDQAGEPDHDADRERKGEPAVEADVVDQAGKAQHREQHHGALGEVEHARRLEDQNEAERHQRVHDACHQPADQHLDEERAASSRC